MSTDNRVPHTVHFRESPNDLQWEEDYPSKEEADRRAYDIYVNGGIALVLPTVTIPHPTDVQPEPQDPENPDD